MLTQRGCDLADVEGVETYVSVSNNRTSLYAKFGFVGYSDAGQETTSMVRLGQLLGFGRSEGGRCGKSDCPTMVHGPAKSTKCWTLPRYHKDLEFAPPKGSLKSKTAIRPPQAF